MKPNVIIADDHPFSRIGVRHHLNHLGLVENLYEADNGLGVMHLLSQHSVNIVFLDVKMPIMDGHETAQIIIRQYPRVKIVILSQYDEEALISNLVKLGIDGYILKGDQNMEEALMTVVKGNYYFSKAIEHYCIRAKEETYRPKPVKLTPREEKLLPLIAKGKNSHEIAEELQLSRFTIESYRKELLAKFELSNSTALVDFAHRTGIL